MPKIKQIIAREILDSRGNPTVEATVTLDDDSRGIASCPSGASVGHHEAVELRDKEENRFRGLGVNRAVQNIEKIIAPELMGVDITSQQTIDKIMIDLDGTDNKAKLGANAILPVSMAVAKASAEHLHLPLYKYIHDVVTQKKEAMKIPIPMFNILNGGKHGGGNIDFQEFMVIPASSVTFTKGFEYGWLISHTLKDTLQKNNFTTLVGDEGGFAPVLQTNESALTFITQAVEAAGLRLGYDVFLGIDAAAGTFFYKDHYKIKDKTSKFSSKDLLMFYELLIKQYHILYLEDPLSEDDEDGWKEAMKILGSETMVVGDDLTVTNPLRLQMAINNKAISGIIIKPNQIGTVSEALAVVEIARVAGIKIAVSHRSGETNDDFIADFAVGVMADYVKFGAPARGERVAKYNRLFAIDAELAHSPA